MQNIVIVFKNKLVNTNMIYKSQLRKYHSYKIASNTLSIFEHDLIQKKNVLKDDAGKQFSKKQTSMLFKEIKKSRSLLEIQNTDQALEAAKNIKRLCDQTYALCQEVENGGFVPEIDEELLCFIEITNEIYPCIQKDLYEKLVKSK